MKTLILSGAALGALLALTTPASAADAAHGKDLFRAQCGACHTAGEGDGDGGLGPALKGVVGRKVGGDPDYAYSQALADSKDKWTADNLSTFLADPQKVMPGTAMPIRVGSAEDRADIAAYLATVKAP
jgi:cytochrome c2